MPNYTTEQAKAQFEDLIVRAACGDEIIIVRDNRPVARIIAAETEAVHSPGQATSNRLAKWEEYRKRMLPHRPCDEAMASEGAAYPPTESDHLRLYHFVEASHAISNLCFRRLKVSTLSNLNDPFEFFSERLPTMNEISQVKEERDLVAKGFGLLCFSEDWKSSAMWAHYAERHKGICLGFDIHKDDVHKVNYESDKIERVKVSKPDGKSVSKKEDISRRLLVKSNDWRYENEQRLFAGLTDDMKEDSLYFHPFQTKLKLAEVILGQECSLKVDAVKDLLKKLYCPAQAIYVFQARIAGKHFNMVPDMDSISKNDANIWDG